MKLSKRLDAIASFISNKDKVLDVGCDHAYLDIYLALNKKNKTIIASDISEEVIKATKENIKRYKLEDKIKVYCTNGTQDIKENYDTLVIAGMGYYNIISILNNTKTVDKLIICSNNNWDFTRKDISSIGYYLDKELLVQDAKKLYSIMLFKKGHKHLSKKEIAIGKYNIDNISSYNILYDETKKVFKRIPNSKIIKKIKYYQKLRYIKSYLRKENR